MEVKVTLGGSSAGVSDVRGGGSDALDLWKKPVYRLAVICVEFPDTKHNEKIAAKDWQASLFSRDTYKNKNSATDDKVYGSMADFYHEVSYGKLRIEGKVFDWVEVKKNRMDYAPGSGTGSKGPLLTEALDKVIARDGKDALGDFRPAGSSSMPATAPVRIAAACTGRIARRCATTARAGRTSSVRKAART